MKKSRYTYCYENTNGNLIIYNSLNGVILKCNDTDKIKRIKDILHGSLDISCLTEDCVAVLRKYGLIIEDDIDEKAIADYRFLKDVLGSRLDLTILPTENCNFRCSYCYETFEKDKMTREAIEQFKKCIYVNIRKYTGVSVAWFGGEPLEAVHEMEIITDAILSACKKRKIPYEAGIVTNGYNLTPDVLKKLIRMRVRQIQVTIDGTQENHNKYKRLQDGSPTYDVVLNNLRYIRDHCKYNTLSVVIRINVSRDLVQDMDDVIAFFHKEFGYDRRFSFFFRPVGNWGGERVKEIEDKVFKLSQVNAVYDKIAQNTTLLNYKMYYLELTKGIEICYAAKSNAYIVGADLKLYKCSCKFHEVCNCIGNINEFGKAQIEENLLSKWTLVGVNPTSKCNQCVLYPVCHNAACIVDSVGGKIVGSVCPHMKQNLDCYLEILSRDPAYCVSL